MAKFYGKIGYIKTEETKPGIWKKVADEKYYSGEFNRRTKRWQNDNKVNDNIAINAEISIVADSYSLENKHFMRYVVLDKVAWEITSIELVYPRLILELGGLYNGELAGDE